MGQTSPMCIIEPPNATILVVDDRPLSLDTLGMLLAEYGYRTCSAGSVMEALDYIVDDAPDLILLDVKLPDVDGYTLCRVLKSDPSTSHIPIIFISDSHETLDTVAAFEFGGADYLTTPIQAAELLFRVKRQLKLVRQQQCFPRGSEPSVRSNRQSREPLWRSTSALSDISEYLEGRILDGKYRIEERVGGGGFGVVYRGTHIGLQRTVAIKIFRPSRNAANDDSRERLLIEGISACRIDHPNAVAVLDSGLSREGIAYLVMELLRGDTLSRELEIRGRLPLHRCAEVVIPLCQALAKAHSVGVIHRGPGIL